jgi:DNA helicase-2/ATP-dependent DNA helicase PcrA
VPYKVVGGVGFYQRREIKDILSYLRVYDNPFDEAAFTRMMKTPPKGAGDSVLAKIQEFSANNHIDLLSAAENLLPVLPTKQAAGLGFGLNVLMRIGACTKISEMINTVIELSGYKEYLKQTETEEEAENRIENLYELFNAAVSYEETLDMSDPDQRKRYLSEFLSTTTLITSGDESAADSVKLMTIHAAKGLEFEAVFLTGLEEGIFPLSSQDDIDDIEEERRLCYVGITRAKVYLCMTYATKRMYHGKSNLMRPSRFLKELNAAPVKEKLERQHTIDVPAGTFHKGQIVEHEIFGSGVVISVSGSGDSAKVDVMFKKHGMKKLVGKFLN